MTVREHFLELKRRLITCLIFLAAGWGIFFALSGDIMEKMIGDAVSFGYTVMAAAPQESLMQQIKLGFYISLSVSFPLFLWHLISFIDPGSGIRSFVKKLGKVSAGFFLFLSGGLLGRFFMVPLMLNFLGTKTAGIGGLMTSVTLKSYMQLYLAGIASSGVAATFPILMYALAGAGLVTCRKMKEKRPYFIVFAFIAAAVLTPPDVVSQVIMGTAFLLFFQIGLWLVSGLERSKNVYFDKKAQDHHSRDRINGDTRFWRRYRL